MSNDILCRFHLSYSVNGFVEFFGQSIIKSNECSTYRALTPDALVYRKATLIKMIKRLKILIMPSNFSLCRLMVVHTLCSKLNEVFLFSYEM